MLVLLTFNTVTFAQGFKEYDYKTAQMSARSNNPSFFKMTGEPLGKIMEIEKGFQNFPLVAVTTIDSLETFVNLKVEMNEDTISCFLYVWHHALPNEDMTKYIQYIFKKVNGVWYTTHKYDVKCGGQKEENILQNFYLDMTINFLEVYKE